MPMFVRTQTERVVYLSGCTNDADGMWDVDVVTSVPEEPQLPAPFGTEDSAPMLNVRLYRYQEDHFVQSALFDEGNEVDVAGRLDAFEPASGALEFDAMLDKPCFGDCSSKRSRVDVAARLTWTPTATP